MAPRATELAERCLRARETALELMARFGLEGWQFAFDRARRRAGCCHYPTGSRPGRITLSVHFVERNPAEEVDETIRHEIAHALAGREAGHGPAWRAACARVGARPVRCYGDDVAMPAGRWRARCPACGKEHHRHRRPRSLTGYHCRPCGPARGKLVWGRDAG